MILRSATPDDAAQILGIYAPFVQDSAISFEQDVPSIADMQGRISQNAARYGYFVAQDGDDIIGYAYGSGFRSRAAYDRTVETSLYISPHHQGRGAGRKLYMHLLDHLRVAKFHTAVAVITLPNAPSIALHKACGFDEAGILKDVGNKFSSWHSIAFYQRSL